MVRAVSSAPLGAESRSYPSSSAPAAKLASPGPPRRASPMRWGADAYGVEAGGCTRGKARGRAWRLLDRLLRTLHGLAPKRQGFGRYAKTQRPLPDPETHRQE